MGPGWEFTLQFLKTVVCARLWWRWEIKLKDSFKPWSLGTASAKPLITVRGKWGKFFYYLKNFNWNIIDLQCCCVSFSYMAKWFSYIYMSVYIDIYMCSVAQLCATLCNSKDRSLPGTSVHSDSPGKNTVVGCHALLKGIFPTQGSNPGLPHCGWFLYYLSHEGNPDICIDLSFFSDSLVISRYWMYFLVLYCRSFLFVYFIYSKVC